MHQICVLKNRKTIGVNFRRSSVSYSYRDPCKFVAEYVRIGSNLGFCLGCIGIQLLSDTFSCKSYTYVGTHIKWHDCSVFAQTWEYANEDQMDEIRWEQISCTLTYLSNTKWAAVRGWHEWSSLEQQLCVTRSVPKNAISWCLIIELMADSLWERFCSADLGISWISPFWSIFLLYR